MKWADLIPIVNVAMKEKPEFGKPCNSCGWCCLTEVCSVGVELSGSTEVPCNYLKNEEGRHVCELAGVLKNELSIGTGCDAKTQAEQLAELAA